MHYNFIFASACLATVASAIGVSNISTAMTKYGPVFTQNVTSHGIAVFKGIPYAAPPIGDLRWRSPVPPNGWIKPLNATSFRDGCYEFSGRTTPWAQSEDCLYLSIWAPKISLKKPRPVMVWIHGGGFEFDSGMNSLFDGVNVVERDVILVTVEYRMGNFGFMARTDLDDEDEIGNSGNYGIQDMILAFRWVKDNIQNFGGDRNNVLAFGESAGAHAMGILMASPLAQGLFDKVIMQSGSWWDSEHGNMESFQQARIRGDTWGQKILHNASLEDLRQLPAAMIVNSSLWDATQDPGTTAFSPNVDKYVIPELVPSVFRAGTQSKIPLLAGYTMREDLAFQTRALSSSNASIFSDRIFDYFNKSGRDEQDIRQGLQTFYPAEPDPQASAFKMVGDFVISQQTWEAIHLHSLTTDQPTFLYMFNFTSEYSPVAAHGSDIAYTFGNFVELEAINSGTPKEADEVLSQNMITYWTNFAKSGNPNTPDTRNGSLTVWPRYEACDPEDQCGSGSVESVSHQILDLGNTIKAANFDSSRFQFVAGFRDNGAFPIGWHDFILP